MTSATKQPRLSGMPVLRLHLDTHATTIIFQSTKTPRGQLSRVLHLKLLQRREFTSMCPKLSASGRVRTPPVTRDGFAFSNGVFFADASGQNRHPRASLAELRAQLLPGNRIDHPAHWFEAQLIHYDLAPCKNKATARTSLLSAVISGTLAVPVHLVRLENELRNEWTKMHREARKEASAVAASTAKRRAAGPVTASDASERAAKKYKVIHAPSPSFYGYQDIQNHHNDACNLEQFKNCEGLKEFGHIEDNPVVKAEDLGNFDINEEVSDDTDPKDDEHLQEHQDFDGACEDLLGLDDGHESGNEFNYHDENPADHDIATSESAPSVMLGALGLLTGSYDIASSVSQERTHVSSDGSLVLAVAGDELWGWFDLGIVKGVLNIPQRPWTSSHNQVPFTWYGRENEGPIIYGNENHGWIKFLGDGRIQGDLGWNGISFSGQRHLGQDTGSDIDARHMGNQWSECSEGLYEMENRARWSDA